MSFSEANVVVFLLAVPYDNSAYSNCFLILSSYILHLGDAIISCYTIFGSCWGTRWGCLLVCFGDACRAFALCLWGFFLPFFFLKYTTCKINILYSGFHATPRKSRIQTDEGCQLS